MGYYDESLSISRNLFELANLFYLFLVSPDELANWLKLTGAKRKRQFSPVNIRLKLENLDEKAVFDADYYGAISDRMVHANPDTLPGAHNPEGRPIVGSLFQAEGWLASTHALFLAVGTFAGSAAKISAQKNIHMKKVVDASIDLVETV